MVTHIDLVVFHVSEGKEFVEVLDVHRTRAGSNSFLGQRRNEVVGCGKSGFLRPDQAVEAAENDVWSFGEALGLDSDTELVSRSLVLLAGSLC